MSGPGSLCVGGGGRGVGGLEGGGGPGEDEVGTHFYFVVPIFFCVGRFFEVCPNVS